MPSSCHEDSIPVPYNANCKQSTLIAAGKAFFPLSLPHKRLTAK
jgi:hypothetical protein